MNPDSMPVTTSRQPSIAIEPKLKPGEASGAILGNGTGVGEALATIVGVGVSIGLSPMLGIAVNVGTGTGVEVAEVASVPVGMST